MSLSVYVCCRMTGRDKQEQVRRARYVCAVLKQYGLNVLHPVLEENVEDKPGPLINDSEDRLKGYWKRDKDIIRYEAQVILVDGAHEKSFGVEREYGLSRWNLWKPTVLVMPNVGLTVSRWEDDVVVSDIHQAGSVIRERWGTIEKRIWWRIKLLIRCLPKRLLDEWYQWR